MLSTLCIMGKLDCAVSNQNSPHRITNEEYLKSHAYTSQLGLTPHQGIDACYGLNARWISVMNSSFWVQQYFTPDAQMTFFSGYANQSAAFSE